MWEINSYQAGSAVEEVQLFLTILTNGVIDKRVLGLWRSQVSECTTVLAILSTASLFVSGGSICLFKQNLHFNTYPLHKVQPFLTLLLKI